MPRFTLGQTGAEGINTGIRGLFQALGQAPYLRQQAEQQAAYLAARAHSAGAAGDKSMAEAETERYTLGNRKGVDDMLADPTLDPFRKKQLFAFKMAGPQYMDNYSKSGETEQKISAIQDIQNNPAMATSTGQAYAAVSGKAPFDNVGDTGRSMNVLTGQGGTLDATLAKLFDNKLISEAGENTAQAENARASAGQHRASTGKIQLETNILRDTDVDGPLSGKPLTNAQRRTNTNVDQARKFIADTPPSRIRAVMSKSEFDLTPADKDLLARVKLARTAKFGERDVPAELNNALGLDQNVIGQVIQALSGPQTTKSLFGMGADRPMTEEEVLANVSKILPPSERTGLEDYVTAARNRMGKREPAKNAGDPPPGNTIGKLPAGVPPGSRLLGTSKGKPVYQTPDGRKLLVE